jgi:type I restriction enzyme, S subunit
MASSWQEISLGEFVTLQRGHDLPETKRSPGSIPVMGSFGLTGYHNEAKTKGPGVTVGRSGASFGVVNFCSVDYWPLNTALYVKNFYENNERFAYFLLKSIDFSAYNSGSAQPSLNRNFIHPIKIKVPPLPEQRAIAHILGTLDDKIELNRRMNETLEGMARAIFKSWFVDFDPVRAKMEGRKPPGLDTKTADLFPDSFQNSPMEKIPKGWEISTIGEEVKVVGGGTPSTKEPKYWDGGNINWATPKDLSKLSAPILLDTNRRLTELGLSKVSSGLLPIGTVLLSSRAPIGYLAISIIPIAINQGFIAMVCEGTIPNYFALQWTNLNMDLIKANANGTTFQEISKKIFRSLPILVPSEPLLDCFNDIAGPIYEKITSNIHESKILASTRDTLLPKLLSGEIRVKDAERFVGEVL